MFEAFEYRVGRRWAWLATAAVLVASAAQAQTTYAVSVDAAGLEPALLSLATQTKQQIMFSKGVVAGRRAPPVKGQMTPEQALTGLLIGTDLRARRVNDQMIVVERVTARPQEAGDSRPFVAENLTAVAASAPALVDEVTVTGSHIRGAPTPSPLVVLDRTQLERTGHATLAAAISSLPQAFGAGASEGTVTTASDRVIRNTSYGASVNLRGLGPDATLILVNGRRLSGSGSFGDFSDISAIPTAAVERVEVLLDGASALYGADAVGGVVNVVLRKDFEGAETRLYAGVGTAGEPLQAQVSHTWGRTWDGGSVMLALEYQKRNRLRSEARDFTATADLRALGGTDHRITNAFPGNILRADPVTGTQVPFWAIPAGQNGVGLRPTDFVAGTVNLTNQRAGLDILPRQQLQSAYLFARQEISDRVEVSGDLRYAFRKYGLALSAPTSTLTVARANPFFVSPNGSSSHSIAYSFSGELENPFQVGSAETWAATAAADVKLFGDWKSEAYVGFAQEIGEARSGGTVNSAYLAEALGNVADRPETAYVAARDGFFNPFGGVSGVNSRSVLEFISQGFSNSRARTRSYVASMQADGSLFDLPGGRLQVALGAQARRETLVRTGSNFSSTVAPTPQSPVDVARETLSAFAELRAPLVGPDNGRSGLRRLELSAAGRIEHYDDTGTTANPKLGVLWQPAEDLTVRATYGRSFRAPALREVSDRPLYSPILLTAREGRIRTLQLSGGNPGLDPETAKSWTLGFDWRPAALPGFNLSLTGFEIRFKNRIDKPVQQNIATVLLDPALASFVTRITPTSNAADLALITRLLADPATTTALGVFPPEAYGAIIDNRYVNTTTLSLRGIDLSAGYRFDLGEGSLALGAAGTWMADFKQQVTPTSGLVERVGRTAFPVKLRGRLTADWTRGPVTLGGAVNYVDATRDPLGARIGDLTTVDLQVRLAPPAHGWAEGVSVSLTVRNLFDTDPPFYDASTGVGFDPTNAEPIGRFVAIQLTRRW